MSDRAQRVEAVFLAALEQPSGRQDDFISAECNGDVALADEVRSLLKNHGGDDGFMDSKDAPGRLLLSNIGILPVPDDEPTLPPDRRIGPYAVIGILGAGGMGVVYVAEQDRPHRTVALKVLRKGIASSRILRRFEYEAEVLGRLHHPGIAQVFEAGTYRETGSEVVRPYIAMELIRGKNLIQHARDEKLRSRAKLELIARVCDAVQHAHHTGVIHRDLKPANILVEPNESPAKPDDTGTAEFSHVGQPKILDFGVARATDAPSQFTTIQSGMGQIIGTLPYMSPEQISGPGEQIDARTDVYAIGAMLYQLLAGKVPHDLRSRALPEVARVVSSEPVQKLSSIDRVFRGDIETIVSKALEKDRARRYQSPADLAGDLRRHLAGLPILARQDSALYVLRTQMRRYRHFVAGAAVFLVTLTTLAIIAIVQASRATKSAEAESIARIVAQEAERAAVQQRNRADATSAELTRQLSRSNIERGRALGAAGSIRPAEELLWREHYQTPASPQTYWALWELYQRQPALATADVGSETYWTAASPDGSTIAVTANNGTVMLRDARTLQALASKRVFASQALGAAFSPDGRLLAVTGITREILLLDPSTLHELARFGEVAGPIRCVTFDQTGTRIAAANNDGTISVYDLATLTSTRRLGRRGPVITRVAIAGDGTIAAGSVSGDLLLWRPGSAIPSRTLAHEGGIATLSFSADSATLASGGNDRTVRLWNVADGQPIGVLESPNGWIKSVCFMPDGRRLVSAGWWNVEVWDVLEHKRLRAYPLAQGVNGGAITPDGAVFVAGYGSFLRSYDLAADPGVRRLPPHDGRCTVAYSPDGEMLATSDNTGRVRLWNARSLAPIHELIGHNARVRSIEFHPSRPIVAAGSEDRSLILWDTTTGRILHRWDRCGDIANRSFNFSPDGRWIATIGTDLVTRIRRVDDGAIVGEMPRVTGELISARFSPDGRRLAVTNRLNQLAVWDVSGLNADPAPTPEQPFTPTLAWKPGALAGEQPWTPLFTADGSRLITGDWSRALAIWSFDSSTPLATLEGHSGLIVDAVLSPRDPDILASSSADGTVKLWSIADRQNLMSIELFQGWDALTLAFDPSGRTLAVASATGQIALVDMDHFQRHIAGNTLFQVERLMRLNCFGGSNDLRNWAARILAAPSPLPANPPK
ncbi:MAG: protein kinase domain-containing protein [Phycisphaerales bacterium]